MDLGPSRESAWHTMSIAIAGVELSELLDEVWTFRTRPNQAHVAAQDVEQLWELVQRRLPDDPTDGTDAVVVRDVPVRLGLRFVDWLQRPELHQLEGDAIAPDPLLSKEHSSARLHADGHGEEGEQRR